MISGRINGIITNTREAVQSRITFYLLWSAVKNDAGNYSDVTVEAYYATTSTSQKFDTQSARSHTITIDGTPTTVSARINCNPWESNPFMFMTATKRVYHNADGTKTITVSAESNAYAGIYGPALDASHPCTASGSVTLETIARGATITSASQFYDVGVNPSVTYSNPIGESASGLQIAISSDGETDDLCAFRDISKTAGLYQFTLTNAEREALRNLLTDGGTEYYVYYLLRTTIGSSVYTESAGAYFTLTENDDTRPTVSVSASIVNPPGFPAKFDGVCIQGKTKLAVDVSASAKYGASVVFTQTNIDGKTYYNDSFTTEELGYPGVAFCETTVWDSRDYSDAARSQDVTVYAYNPPQVIPVDGTGSVMAYRSDNIGTPSSDSTSIWVKAKRRYSTVNGLNGCVIRWRSRQEGGSWSGWTNLTLSGDSYNGLISGTFIVSESYKIQIGVLDDVGEENYIEFDIPTGDVPLHLGAGGKSVGIGRYADTETPHSLKIGYETFFDEDVNIRVNGVYTTLADYIRSIVQ